MIKYCGWLIGLSLLLGAKVQAQDLTYIDPNPKTGTSAAVVVADSLPLIHTGQFGGGGYRAKLEEMLDRSFRELEETLRVSDSSLDRVVKLNFVGMIDNPEPFERYLAKRFAGKHKPAVSYVRGETILKPGYGVYAMDAVAVGTRRESWKQVEHGNRKFDGLVLDSFTIMPPGTRVYVSGQAVDGKNLAEATRKTLEELRDTLKFLGLNESSIVQLKAFFGDVKEHKTVTEEVEKFFGDKKVPPLIMVEWKSSLPIEIELIAWGGKLRYGVPIEYLTPPGMKASPNYSRVARVNDGKLIYLSSFYGAKDNDPAAEITDVFEQMGKVLEKAGSDYRHLAKATYYVTSAEATKKVGELRPKYYDPKRPPAASLAMVPGTGMKDKTVTMDMIAVPSPRVKVNDYGPAEHGKDLEKLKLPGELLPILNQQDLVNWKAIKHPKLPEQRQAKWSIKDGVLTAVGGPGCLEYQDKQFANFVLQLEVRTKARHANSGVFFRAIPGDFMNGYEAQIYNRCHDGDVSKPWTWATGAIDHRQNARRLVSRDGEWFHYTIIAVGNRIATWVNGYQTVDLLDERKEDENPRLGRRTKAGAIQLQAHDEATEVEFRNIRIAEWK